VQHQAASLGGTTRALLRKYEKLTVDNESFVVDEQRRIPLAKGA